MQDTIVKFENISMQFPGVLANDSVSLEIKRGEVFALVGRKRRGKEHADEHTVWSSQAYGRKYIRKRREDRRNLSLWRL